MQSNQRLCYCVEPLAFTKCFGYFLPGYRRRQQHRSTWFPRHEGQGQARRLDSEEGDVKGGCHDPVHRLRQEDARDTRNGLNSKPRLQLYFLPPMDYSPS